VLEFEPDNAFALYNLGHLAAAGGDRAAAQARFQQALAAKPDFPEARVALANEYDLLDRSLDAERELRAALALRPDYAGAWYNLALVLRRLRRFDESEDALRRVLAIDPGHAAASTALGTLLFGAGRVAEALERFAEARAAQPSDPARESVELLTLLHSDTATSELLFERHREYGERLERAHGAAKARVAQPRGRLRIGYVTDDFRLHSMAPILLPVVEHHDRSRFEVHCFMTGRAQDAITAQARRYAGEHWHDAGTMSDAEVAQMVHRHGIDILVDAMGHSGATRLGVFARRPAPLQVAWLGYLHSTGMRSIACRLVDKYTDPPGMTEHLHVERLERLPHSQWCYRPLYPEVEPSPAPCVVNGYITFGSFNIQPKVSATVLRQWRALLERLPTARLFIADARPGRVRERLQAEIGSDRIEFAPYVPFIEYFRLFHRVDIALDSWPFNGGTTTLDSLWMGVPVLSAAGPRAVSRNSATLLGSVGLQDWIAPSIDAYVDLAVEKARDGAALAALRPTLRSRLQASPLMDERAFTRNLEAAYQRLWQRQWENPAHGV
jgi:protein O-GlcNAc transferase